MVVFSRLLLSFLVFFQINAFAEDLFPNVEDVGPGLTCFAEGTSLEFCQYHKKWADIQYLITQAHMDIGNRFGSPGFIDDSVGYVKPGNNYKTLNFSFKDKNLMEDFKKYIVSIDTSAAPYKNREAHFLVKLYLVSTVRALEKGFNIDLLGDGVVEENTPRLFGQGNTINWNIGNLVNQALSITFKRAKTTGIVIKTDNLNFSAEHGTGSPYQSTQNLYHGVGVGTEIEVAPRSVSGMVSLDPNNPKKITFLNFTLKFYLPINANNSLIRTVSISKPALYLESGVQQVIVSNDETTESVNTQTGLLSRETSQELNQFKIVASIVGTTEDKGKLNGYLDETRSLYAFDDTQISQMLKGEDQNLTDFLSKEKLNYQLIKSPIGYLGESIAIQFSPKNMTQSLLKTKVLVSVTGKGLRPVTVPLALENLTAGPLFLDDDYFSPAILEKNRNGKLDFTLAIDEDTSYSKAPRGNSTRPLSKSYNFIYNLKNGTLDLISESP